MSVWNIANDGWLFTFGSYVGNHLNAVVFGFDVVDFGALRSVEKLLLIFGFIVDCCIAKGCALEVFVVNETVYSLVKYFLIAEDTLGRFLKINDLFHELVFVESLLVWPSNWSSRAVSCSSCILLWGCPSVPRFSTIWSVANDTLLTVQRTLNRWCTKHCLNLILFLY